MTFEVAGDVSEDALNIFIQVYSLCFVFQKLLLLLISPKSRQSFRVNTLSPLFQELLWEKTFQNKDGQPMTVIRSKVQWSRLAVICKCRLLIL